MQAETSHIIVEKTRPVIPLCKLGLLIVQAETCAIIVQAETCLLIAEVEICYVIIQAKTWYIIV